MQQRNHTNDTEPLASPTPGEITQDVMGSFLPLPRGYWRAVIILGALFLVGVLAFLWRLLGDGLGERTPWGYYAVLFSFLLTVTGGAPLVAVGLRLARAHWQKPLVRASELFAVVGILNLLLFIPLLWLMPPLQGRNNIWFLFFQERGELLGPRILDTLAILFLVICGLALLYVAALPDLVAIRPHAKGGLRGFVARITPTWQGTPRQWLVLRVGIGILGAFYFMFFVYVQTLFSTEFAMSLVPGWLDAIFPPHQALSGLQSAVAVLLVALFFLRWQGGLKKYILMDQFWGLSKLLLALSLLWAYFWWAGFLTFWYGRSPTEQNLVELLMVGPYRIASWAAFFLCFVIPVFFLLIWNPVRKSVLGPTLAGVSVLIGTFFDRVRVYVGAFSVEESTGSLLEHVPPVHWPDVADVLLIIGGLAGAVLLYLIAVKVVPSVSLWEVKEGALLERSRSLLRMKVRVLGKPD